jgi:hypothetical protein
VIVRSPNTSVTYGPGRRQRGNRPPRNQRERFYYGLSRIEFVSTTKSWSKKDSVLVRSHPLVDDRQGVLVSSLLLPKARSSASTAGSSPPRSPMTRQSAERR